MISAVSLLLLIHLASSLQNVKLYNNFNSTTGNTVHENILCRNCGNEIAFSSRIISKVTPFSLYSFHDSILGKEEVLIQVLTSDFFLPYPVITTSHSNCVGVPEWEETDSWFPGYRWTPCVCPDCGALVGWVFEPINPHFVDQPGGFFGLILTSLIGESFINSLAVVPGGLSN